MSVGFLLDVLSLLAVTAFDQRETRTTCGSLYRSGAEGPPCPEPRWAPEYRLNVSTIVASLANSSWYDPSKAAAWGLVTFDWQLGGDVWQNVHPHNAEEVYEEQCRRVKAQGTGTKCFVYRQVELSLQWMKTQREAQTEGNASMYLQFKTPELCDAAPPCNVASFHQCNGGTCDPCNATAPLKSPNCPYCCNFTRVYNEPIGGGWPKPARGDNALGDGQLFFDHRKQEVQRFWAEHVIWGAVASDNVDGVFTDDPAGYGQEHPAVQTAVQLSAAEIRALQYGTQVAWNRALNMMIQRKKFVYQAFRGVSAGPSSTSGVACTQWMREQCGRPANNSAVIYPQPSSTDLKAANLSIASFLVTRGAYSYIAANSDVIENRNSSDPFYKLFQLEVGTPVGRCVEQEPGVFIRSWSHGKATVDCSSHDTPRGILDYAQSVPDLLII
eukprot:gnl/TRDRNA2_/TRDRNA2_173612_c1_seq1.p1 gnl/TRDRNA2_/TRDRNA2_173612_c1~~gnl/TRDRNA2_/TRDRNA2_173612_c1_seq1.p1  ORF type:complete len:441 (+),score=32.31 gnl/TRDRNA2_/TRDRNA2_173612_c1_seq1:50-1372(+)